MARINLLPWRQAERERKNREFLTLAAGILLLSLLAAFAAWSYFNNTLESQQQANEAIKKENANLDKALTEIDTLEKQRDEMISRMKVIQDLGRAKSMASLRCAVNCFRTFASMMSSAQPLTRAATRSRFPSTAATGSPKLIEAMAAAV